MRIRIEHKSVNRDGVIESAETTLAEFLAVNEEIEEAEAASITAALERSGSYRMAGFVGCYADITRLEEA